MDAGARDYFDQAFAQGRRVGALQRVVWEDKDEMLGLLLRAGAYAPPGIAEFMWQTPMSMRNVDAECRARCRRFRPAKGGAL